MAAYEPQVTYLRELLLSSKKQTAYGQAGGLAAGEFTYRARFDGGIYATISKEFYSDLERAGKGHPWPTVRTEVQRMISIGGEIDIDDFLAAWLIAFMLKKVVTTGAGPYTHTCTFEQTTRQAPVTAIYCKDTADVFFRVRDLVMTQLTIRGGASGPLRASFQMEGSGQHIDGSVTAPALPTPVYLMGQDTSILLGAPSSAAALDIPRLREWEVSFSDGSYHRRAPGGGLYGAQANIGLQRCGVRVMVAAKDTDDMRTLQLNDTLRELQINTNSGAAAQLNFKFPNLKFPPRPPQNDGIEIIWPLEAGEQDILKGSGLNLVEAVAINSQAPYLVGAS